MSCGDIGEAVGAEFLLLGLGSVESQEGKFSGAKVAVKEGGHAQRKNPVVKQMSPCTSGQSSVEQKGHNRSTIYYLSGL